MQNFVPDYNNLVKAANNGKPDRIPLYDHNVDEPFISKYIDKDLASLYNSNDSDDIRLYFKYFCEFFKEMGYDTVSFEYCISHAMPGSGSLGGHKPGEIKNRKDFDAYKWDEVEGIFFNQASVYFEILREQLPEGMKIVGGVGNGVFECVQEIVGYESLCLLKFDAPDLYEKLFETLGEIISDIWKRFLDNFADIYAVCRFGDDLGYKSSTMLSAEDIKANIIPQYRKVVDVVHSYGRPFLLHSCGCIFNVMDDLIEDAKIDAKHSNEDAIAPFNSWVEKYGHKIGNFGGIDMDVLCQKNKDEIREYTLSVLEKTSGRGGVAYGSGNSIPNYVPIDGYLAMNRAIREFRGERVSLLSG